MTAYFVTGATGFIGRHLVERLLEREGDIHVLVREGSREKLDALIERWGQPDRDQAGGRRPRRAAASASTRPTLPKIDHFFHLAAIYDMGADETRNALLNVGGTQNAIDLANALEVGTLPPHVLDRRRRRSTTRASSPRTCSTRARSWPTRTTGRSSSPRSSSASACKAPWRVYRPASSSATAGPARWTRSTGPTTSSRSIQKVRHALPEWFPLISLEWGWTNIVPVDYVAAAVDHIAHQDGLDGQAFHVVDPKGQRVGEVLNTFAEAGARAQGRDADRQARDAEPAQGRRSASR